MLPDRLGDSVQEDSWWIKDTQASDRGDVLRNDIFGLCSRMQQSFAVAVVSWERSWRADSRRVQFVHKHLSLVYFDQAVLMSVG